MAEGVGYRVTKSDNVVPGLPVFDPAPLFWVQFRELRESPTVGVGTEEEPSFADVRRSNGLCAVHPPLRIEPEAGKPLEDVAQSAGAEPGDVLKEDESCPAVADDVEDVVEQPSFVGGASAFAGEAVGLAGESSRHEIHLPTPRAAVEGA